MKRNTNIFFLCFLVEFISPINNYAQEDSISHKGTIKIVKAQKQIYIKAYASYQMYRTRNTSLKSSYNDFVKTSVRVTPTSPDQIIEPKPIAFSYYEAFNYNNYFNSNIGLKSISLGDKNCDTIKIRIEVLSNKQFYYYNIGEKKTATTSLTKGTTKYEYSTAQIATMLALQEIRQWEPAYQFIPQYTTKKKKKKLKFNKEILNAEGILTVIYSTTPFLEE